MPFTKEEMVAECNGIYEYMPTPQDIRRECDRIREGWSRREEQSRLAKADRCVRATTRVLSLHEFGLGFQRLIRSENKLHG